MNIKGKILILLALWYVISSPIPTCGNSWGIERGRANQGDASQLLVDQLALKMAQNRIEAAMTRSLAAEGQKELIGKSDSYSVTRTELLNEAYEWWRKDVMRPAESIAGNPAASCAEAQVAVQLLLGMMRQRQLLGISPDETDFSDNATKIRGIENEISEMFNSSRAKFSTRCREEALDECVMTGRFEQLLQTDLGLSRQDQLLSTGAESNDDWVDDALKQCAIYELHFVSTTKVTPIFNIETVLDGKIKLEFEAGAGGVLKAYLGGKKLGDLLNGQTTGGANPFLVSVKCAQPGVPVVCSPGATVNPVMARVNTMELKHREFYVDSNGISRERNVGEDKFLFDFSGGIFSIEMLVKVPNAPTIPVPMGAHGFNFYIAHKKDRLGTGRGEGTTVRIENSKRGAYPVIFDFTYADQATEGSVPASDSTEFQLIHKPRPKPIERVPEPTRKPLKPRPGLVD